MLGMGAINVLFIPFLVTELGASPAWAGPLEAAQTISMIVAGGVVASLATRVSVPRLFVGGIVGLAACVGLLAIAPGPWALLVIMFAVGLFVMPVQATTMTLVQRSTGDGTRGRVAGALNAAIQTASIGSMAAAGILADVIGIRVGVRARRASSRSSPRSSPRSCSAGRPPASPPRPPGRRHRPPPDRSAHDEERRRPRGRRRSRAFQVRRAQPPARQSPTVCLQPPDHRAVVAARRVRIHPGA